MIGSLLKIGAALAGLAQDAFAYFRKKDDQNTGKQLAAGEINKQVIDETQAVNDARADVANVERVRGQSFRD